MKNYLEKFKNTYDLEEIREILKEIRKEDLPPEMIIHPRIIANKIKDMEDIEMLTDLLHILYEEGYDPYWEEYIPYTFFLEKIKETEDIEDIGELLFILLDIDYPVDLIFADLTLDETLEKINESFDFRDILRYYLGFIEGNHKELIEFLDQNITIEEISLLFENAENICDIVLIIHFSLALKGIYPTLSIQKEKIAEFIEKSPIACITEFIHILREIEKKKVDYIIPYLNNVELEDEEFSEVLDLYEALIMVYDYKKKKPREIRKIFTPFIMRKLKEKDIDLESLRKGLILLHSLFSGIDFLEDLSIWERFKEKWEPRNLASLIATLLDMGYPLSKIPEEMLVHYLLYYEIFAPFLYHFSELFSNIKIYRDRAITFIRDLVHIAGEEKTLTLLLSLMSDRFLSTLGFLRGTINILEDLTLYPDLIERIIDGFSQLSELEEFSSMLNTREKGLFLSLIEPKKLKNFILSSGGLSDIGIFISRFSDSRDTFSNRVIGVFNTLTKDEIGMLLSLEENPDRIRDFLYDIEILYKNKDYKFGEKIPSQILMEKLYSITNLEDLMIIFELLLRIGFNKDNIKGKFLRDLFTRKDIPIYELWTHSFVNKKYSKEESLYEDLPIKQRDEYFKTEENLPEGYAHLFYPILLFYKESKEKGIGGEWVKGFCIKDIEHTIKTARIEYVNAFLELLYYGGYEKESILKLPYSIFEDILKNKRDGTQSLFMKKRLIDILSLWEYPTEWIEKFTPDDIVRIIQKEKELKDLDIFLIGIKNSGFSLEKIDRLFHLQAFYEIIKDTPFTDLVNILKPYGIFNISPPLDILKSTFERESSKNIDIFGFNLFVQSFPLVKMFPYTAFWPVIEKFINNKYIEILENAHAYKNFIRLLTYTRGEKYDKILKKLYVSHYNKEKKMEEDIFLGLLDENALN